MQGKARTFPGFNCSIVVVERGLVALEEIIRDTTEAEHLAFVRMSTVQSGREGFDRVLVPDLFEESLACRELALRTLRGGGGVRCTAPPAASRHSGTGPC
jgi:hypothetical protein